MVGGLLDLSRIGPENSSSILVKTSCFGFADKRWQRITKSVDPLYLVRCLECRRCNGQRLASGDWKMVDVR